MICFDSVDSTNNAAKRLIADGLLTANAIVAAREQTAGRGTQGRSWISPRDAGLYFSIITLDVGVATPDITLHTLAAGVGCAEVLNKLPQVRVRLKPINDLIAAGGKVGGILTEALIESGRLVALITGIGINTRRADRRPDAATLRPVSLEELMDRSAFSRLDMEGLIETSVDAVLRWQRFVIAGEADKVQRAFALLTWDQLQYRSEEINE